MNRKILAIFILTSSIVLGASAQSRILPILEANPDIRTAAMGNTMLGSTNQMYIYSNPAALTFGPRRLSIDASTIAYPKSEDGRLMQYVASAGYKFANRSALLAGVRYQGGLTVQGNEQTNQRNTISPYDLTIDLGYSFAVVPELAVYATATYAKSRAATSTNAYAFSVGAAYQKAFRLSATLPTRLTIGARLLDLGKPVKFNDTGLPYSLPTSVAVGGDWNVNIARQHALTYALSCRHFTPKAAHETLVGTGLEYTYNKMVFLRMGYQFSDKAANAITFGAGGEFAGLKFNVAYNRTFADYGLDTFLIGLGYTF